MGQSIRTRAFGAKEVLLAISVVVVAAAILYPLAIRQQDKSLLLDESGRMRRLYVALTFYEEQYDGQPAPSLAVAATFNPNRVNYLSDLDPFRDSKAQSFPLDPGILNRESSAFRISFSYIQNFIRNDKIRVKPWAEARTDPKIGEIADEWTGGVSPGKPFAAQVSGPVIRIGTDGAVFVLADRGGPKALGDAGDLFLKR